MAVYSASWSLDTLSAECADCPLCDTGCPVFFAHHEGLHGAMKNPLAENILNILVKQNGECQVKQKIMKVIGERWANATDAKSQ